MVTTEDSQQSNSNLSIPKESSKPIGKTALLGLAASLQNDREATMRWVDEAPLRLLAAVLVDSRRRASSSEIKAALTAEIIDPEGWKKWWDVVRPALTDSPHFQYVSRKPIRLLHTTNLTDLCAHSLDDLRPAARSATRLASQNRETSGPAPALTGLGGWILWAQADEDEPIPRSAPSDDFITFLGRLPESVIPTVVSRLLSGVEQRLIDSKQKPAENSIEMWQAALAAALRRWSDLSCPPGVSVREIITLAVRILEELGSHEFEDTVDWLTDFTSQSANNSESVCDALLYVSAVAPSGTENLLTRMYRLLDAPVRMALWKRLLGKGLVQSHIPPLRRWIAILEEEDRYILFSKLIASNSDDGAVKRINDILMTEWRIANSEQRYQLFDAVALSWVLHWRSMPESRAAMIEVASVASGEEKVEESLFSEWRDIIRHLSEREIAHVREDGEQRIVELEARIRGNEAELDRTKKYVRLLEGENRSKRKAAELEISRDAIKLLGITLQGIAGSSISKSKEMLGVESNILLALSTLGARQFGTIGDVVPFDPIAHEASPTPARGTLVRIVAPGINYFRHSDTPVSLLKARTTE